MIGFGIKEFQAGFFDRTKVMDAVDKATRKTLSKFGAFVRTRAKSSIRPAGRKKMGELTVEERQSIHIRTSMALKEGSPKPKLPFKASRPGEPPRSRTGLLKRFIFFAYEPVAQNVIIGAARFARSTMAQEVLEHGGVPQERSFRLQPRPFMRPAFEAELSGLPALWRNAVK